MATKSTIEWTEATWNPLTGCDKISPGCKHCYAESQNKLRKWNGGTWGLGALRKVLSKSNWDAPLNWDKKVAEGMHGKDGKRWLVFGGDLCDIFDDEGPLEARDRMWGLIRSTPHLTWMLLTKRPENFTNYLPCDWGDGYANVWLGVTCENREHGYPRVEILRNTPATMRFLSCEPLLEDISDIDLTGINWVITGGESGNGSRAFDLAWARRLKTLCARAGATFFFKQLGSKPIEDGTPFNILHAQVNGKRDAHGKSSNNFPMDLLVQAWPQAATIAPFSRPLLGLTPGQKAEATRKRNLAAEREGIRAGAKPGLNVVSSADSIAEVQQEVAPIPIEELEHVICWIKAHTGIPGPTGNVAVAALGSLAALKQMSAASNGTASSLSNRELPETIQLDDALVAAK